MSTKPFVYQDPFPLGKDETTYRKIEGSEKYVLVEKFADKDVIRICPEALSILANELCGMSHSCCVRPTTSR